MSNNEYLLNSQTCRGIRPNLILYYAASTAGRNSRLSEVNLKTPLA